MKDSRMLMEWLDANGNKITLNNPITTNTSAAKSTKANFTEKYKKLYTHVKDVWGGLNIMRCAMHELEIYYGDYYNRTQPWHHLIIRYIPTEGCFEVNLSERGTGILIYAGEADCWAELLDILIQTETIKDRKLCEWVDAKGNKVSFNGNINKPTTSNKTEEVVYIWDIYLDPRDKGNWCSAEKNNNEYDGFVYATRVDARRGGFNHLCELEDEGQLRGDFSDYTVEAVAIPKAEVSEYTLRFSGL